MNSGPQRSETISWPDMERILLQAFTEIKPRIIVFTGGEPLLLGDDLVRAIQLCTNHGVTTRVVTNGYWANSRENARARLQELKDAGLSDVNISTDDHHLPWISLQRVRWAVEEARALGFNVVGIPACSGPASALTPEALNRYLGDGQMVYRFSDEGAPLLTNATAEQGRLGLISNTHTQYLGRGATALATSEVHEGTRDGEEGGCQWAVRWPAISPKGHLLSCCGFEVEDNPILDYGSLKEHSLAELLDRADDDLITNAIATFGPAVIKRVLEKLCPDELSFRESYRGICEVCQDLVTIPQNRQALLRHQGVFAERLLQIRERAGTDPS
jgi:hypothetical protein